MSEDLLDDDLDGPEEDDLEGQPAAERPTRGLLWVVGPTLVGLLLGAAYKAVTLIGSTDGVSTVAVVPAAAIGAGVGLGVGAIIWAFFPYKAEAKRDRREQ